MIIKQQLDYYYNINIILNYDFQNIRVIYIDCIDLRKSGQKPPSRSYLETSFTLTMYILHRISERYIL